MEESGGDVLHRVNADSLSIPHNLKLHNPVRFGKQGIVPTHAHILSWMKFGSQLTDQDISGPYDLAAKTFNASALAFTVSAIARTTTGLFMCHD
jgi:hypothetical protein